MKTLTDYRGVNYRLTDERLRHILEHPEMAGLEPLIERALQHPELVIRSRSDENVALYYLLLPEARVGVKWLCVVAKRQENDGFVLTAYLTDKPKKGERIWPST